LSGVGVGSKEGKELYFYKIYLPMKRVWVIIMVMLALTAVYFLVINTNKPSQPQVVVVRPSDGQNTARPIQTQPQAETSAPVAVNPQALAGGPFGCVRAVYLKVGTTSLCADVIYSVAKVDDTLQIDFQGGVVHGVFTLVSVPCTITTTPQGVFIPCRATVTIPLKQ
jgi:hypothetical protein